MTFNYSLNTGDYRNAVYFATAIRLHRSIKIAVTVVGISIVYTVLGYLLMLPFHMLPAYVCIGYTLWGFYVLGTTEMAILKYLKTNDTILGKEMTVTMNELVIDLAIEGEQSRIFVEQLFAAFETYALFNIYITPEQTILLPKRGMTEDEIKSLRSIFSRKLKDRFETRFNPKTTKQKR